MGRVKWFNGLIGYGFITVVCDAPGAAGPPRDVFVHHTALQQGCTSLVGGEYVEFGTCGEGEETQALNVTGVMRGPLLGASVKRRQGDADGLNCVSVPSGVYVA